MALGLDEALGERLAGGVVSDAYASGKLLDSTRWQRFAGGHPLPNDASLEAAHAAFALLDRANAEQAVVIFLISGGGSAMIEAPVNEQISLADLRLANQVLVGCGARIAEINAVRRAFSAVKGGGLARRAQQAATFTFIVSDTNRGDEANVASGPTLAAPGESPFAADVIERYHLETQLPASIMNAVRQHRTAQPASCPYTVLLGNWNATEAASQKAQKLGFAPFVAADISEQPIDEGCELLLSRFLQTARHQRDAFCLISGGEFACPVRGDGRGGRNLETVLRCALRLDEDGRDQHPLLVLSAGTDGVDGNSPAAGAFADERTIKRARDLGLNAEDFLARSDSYTFFARSGGLIATDPTGTNVRDLRLFGIPS